MPSRRIVALIVFFWLLTSGYVAYRDIWPRVFASDPPQAAIELTDEATQTVPIRWTIYRNNQKIGKLISVTSHVDEDDSFWFTNEYKELKLEASGVKVLFPKMISSSHVTRGGDLLEEKLDGKIEVPLFKMEATVNIHGKVVQGQLLAGCDIKSSIGDFQQKLDSVAVPRGQPLNPLQPLNRLTQLKPGLSWSVQMSSPLDEAIAAVVRKEIKKHGFSLPEGSNKTVLAQVLSEPRTMDWQGAAQACHVIQYRQEEPVAHTWVRISDGKVLKQEAFRGGENLSIEREN